MTARHRFTIDGSQGTGQLQLLRYLEKRAALLHAASLIARGQYEVAQFAHAARPYAVEIQLVEDVPPPNAEERVT